MHVGMVGMSVVVVTMVVMVMVVMIFVVMIFVVMIVMIFVVMIVMLVSMNLAIKVFSFAPNKGRPNGSLNGDRAAIAQAPLHHTTKQTIQGVVLGVVLKVGLISSMTFQQDDWGEIKLTCFWRLITSPMGAMGMDRRDRGERAQQKSQKDKT